MSNFTPVNDLPEAPDPARAERMRWWRDARLGLFVHFGPYSVLGRGEWAMQQEHITPEEYTTYGDQLLPSQGSVERWVLLAAQAGCKYMVLTAKHCDGYCLWGSSQTDFNSVRRGPRRDLVREYVETCRSLGIKVGIYYGLMDWRHPDGDRCAIDESARRRFVDFTHANVLELMSNYGKIDVLWFDGPWPMPTPEQWDAAQLLDKVRKLQPSIIINNRLRVAEDFSTPEGHISPATVKGRDWEASMTLNGDWGYSDTPPADYRSTRDILRLLRQTTAFGGNLLLNVGPRGGGQIPEPAAEKLKSLGRWLEVHGEAVYGDLHPVEGIVEPWCNTGFWTLRKGEGETWIGFYWLLRGDPHGSFSIAGLSPAPTRVTLMHTGEEVRVTPHGHRLRIEAVPDLASEPAAGTPVLRFEFPSKPRQQLGAGMIELPPDKAAWW